MNLDAALINPLEDPNYEQKPLVHFFWIFTRGVQIKGVFRCNYLYNKHYLSLGSHHLPREHPKREAGKVHAVPLIHITGVSKCNLSLCLF